MKILHLVRSLDIGNLAGGAEKFAMVLGMELAARVDQQMFGVMYQTGSTVESQCLEQLRSRGCEVVFLHRGQKLQVMRSLWILGRLLREFQPDIVQSHSQIAGLLIALIGGRRFFFVRTVHTDREWGNHPLAWAARALATEWIFPLACDAQVAVSQSIFNHLKHSSAARWRHKPIRLIPNALPMEYADQLRQAKSRLYREHSQMVLGTAGRLTHGKGLEDLLAAFQIVRQSIPDARLWIIGEGELRRPLEEGAQALGISNGVAFWGQQEKMPELYRQMDLFVLPSLSEGLPTVLLESMACGTPVMASNIPGVTDIIEDGITGWLIPPQNPAALARALVQHLAVDAEYLQVARAAIQQAEKYLIAEVARQYLDLYYSRRSIDILPVQREN